MNDKLSQRRLELPILEREHLRGTSPRADAGVTIPNGRDKLLRRIDGADGGRSQPPGQFPGQRTRTAADIEHPLTGGDASELGEPGRQRRRIPAHEPVVLVGPSAEAHTSNLRSDNPAWLTIWVREHPSPGRLASSSQHRESEQSEIWPVTVREHEGSGIPRGCPRDRRAASARCTSSSERAPTRLRRASEGQWRG